MPSDTLKRHQRKCLHHQPVPGDLSAQNKGVHSMMSREVDVSSEVIANTRSSASPGHLNVEKPHLSEPNGFTTGQGQFQQPVEQDILGQGYEISVPLPFEDLQTLCTSWPFFLDFESGQRLDAEDTHAVDTNGDVYNTNHPYNNNNNEVSAQEGGIPQEDDLRPEERAWRPISAWRSAFSVQYVDSLLCFSNINPLGAKCLHVRRVCSQGPYALPESTLEYFTSDYVENFIRVFAETFARHTPIIHLQTFQITEASPFLIFAIASVGNAQAPANLKIKHLRTVQQMARSLLEDAESQLVESRVMREDLETNIVQAMVILQFSAVIGNPSQDLIKSDLAEIVSRCRKYNCFNQQPWGFSQDGTMDELEWKRWAKHESRVRAMYGVLILSNGRTLWRNVAPEFGHHEVNIPVPCSDEAWEARNAREAGTALAKEGLLPIFGDVLHRLINPDIMSTDNLPSSGFLKAITILSLHGLLWTHNQYVQLTNPNGDPRIRQKALQPTTRALIECRKVWMRQGLHTPNNLLQPFDRVALEIWWLAIIFVLRDRTRNFQIETKSEDYYREILKMSRVLRHFVAADEQLESLFHTQGYEMHDIMETAMKLWQDRSHDF